MTQIEQIFQLFACFSQTLSRYCVEIEATLLRRNAYCRSTSPTSNISSPGHFLIHGKRFAFYWMVPFRQKRTEYRQETSKSWKLNQASNFSWDLAQTSSDPNIFQARNCIRTLLSHVVFYKVAEVNEKIDIFWHIILNFDNFTLLLIKFSLSKRKSIKFALFPV